jgi:hypothetical protein
MSHMAPEPLRVLLVQSWVIPGTELRAALRSAGYAPKLFRVDFEAALTAALSHGTYDVIVLDAASTGLFRATVEALQRQAGTTTPVIELGRIDELAEAIRIALAARRN